MYKNYTFVDADEILDRDSPKYKLITNAITKLFVWDLQPFNILENKGFKLLMNTLAPDYIIPDRKFFSSKVVPELYKQEKQKLLSEISTDLQGILLKCTIFIYFKRKLYNAQICIHFRSVYSDNYYRWVDISKCKVIYVIDFALYN